MRSDRNKGITYRAHLQSWRPSLTANLLRPVFRRDARGQNISVEHHPAQSFSDIISTRGPKAAKTGVLHLVTSICLEYPTVELLGSAFSDGVPEEF